MTDNAPNGAAFLTEASGLPRFAYVPDHTVYPAYLDTTFTPPQLMVWNGTTWIVGATSKPVVLSSGVAKGSSRYVALGDSISIWTDTQLSFGTVFPHMLACLSQGRIQYVNNAGVSGNTTAMMLARFDSDVTPYNPTLVSLLAGTNDVITAVPDATTRANIKTLVQKILNIGAEPLLFTIPPYQASGFTSAQQQRVISFNAWLLRYARFNSIRIVDAYAKLVDPASAGLYLAANVQPDGIHPTTQGWAVIAQAAFDILYPQGLPGPVGLASANLDATNLITNGLFQTAGSGGFGASWALDHPPTSGTVTPTIVSDAVMPGGKAQRLTLAAASGGSGFTGSANTGWTPGDTLEMAVAVNIQAPNAYALVTAQTFGGSGILVTSQTSAQGRQVLRHEFVVPAGTGGIGVSFDAVGGPGGASGTIDWGGVTVRNLSTGAMLVP